MEIHFETAELAVKRVPRHSLSGEDCGLACEICPLRKYKALSANVGNMLCKEILAQEFARVRARN